MRKELVLKAKFNNPDLCNMLLNTNDDHLEETNDWGEHTWHNADGTPPSTK